MTESTNNITPAPGLIAELLALADSAVGVWGKYDKAYRDGEINTLFDPDGLAEAENHLAHIKDMLPERPDYTGELLDIAKQAMAGWKRGIQCSIENYNGTVEDYDPEMPELAARLVDLENGTSGPAVTRTVGPFEDELIGMLDQLLHSLRPQQIFADLESRIAEIKAARQ